MKLGETITTIPTIGFNVETVVMNNINFTMWDTGGRVKHLAKKFYEGCEVFIVVIDSNDKERIPEIKNEIVSDLKNENLKDSLILFLANKQDIPGALKPTEIVELLDLNKIEQNWSIQPISAMEGTGIKEAFDWVSEYLSKRRK
jgi:small GTP-binding protein